MYVFVCLGGLVDGSLLVMEGCLSVLIDLHSSDDNGILQVFRDIIKVV